MDDFIFVARLTIDGLGMAGEVLVYVCCTLWLKDRRAS